MVFNGEGGYSVKVLKEVIKTVAREQCSARVCLCLALRFLLSSVCSIFVPFKDSVQTMSLYWIPRSSSSRPFFCALGQDYALLCKVWLRN